LVEVVELRVQRPAVLAALAAVLDGLLAVQVLLDKETTERHLPLDLMEVYIGVVAVAVLVVLDFLKTQLLLVTQVEQGQRRQ
jgi:hypothetical protein